jgi:phosphonatase-like hydrolase
MEFPMEMLDVVVFDMAGTTIQAADQVPAAFQQAFARLGVELSDEEIRSVRGRSKHEVISDLVTRHLSPVDGPRLVTEVHSDFRNILMECYERQEVEPVDGAEATFDWLRTRGVKVALTTGFDGALAALLVRKVGWEGSTDAVVSNDDVPRGRPAPYLVFRAMELTGCESVHRVAVVGDTVSDLEAAENAGARWRIGVLSGAHSEAQLKSCPHTAIILSVAELPSLFSA